jgi:hypothetical protein
MLVCSRLRGSLVSANGLVFDDVRAELFCRALQRGHHVDIFRRWSLQDEDLKPSFGHEILH